MIFYAIGECMQTFDGKSRQLKKKKVWISVHFNGPVFAFLNSKLPLCIGAVIKSTKLRIKSHIKVFCGEIAVKNRGTSGPDAKRET